MDVTTPLIALQDIQFSQNKISLLKNISFDAYAQQALALVGTNGAGKSTTLKICARTLLPTNGLILSKLENQALDIGFLPDKAPTLNDWKVITYLKHIAQIRQIKNTQKAIDRVIDLCHLSYIIDKPIKTLSKGNHQRVGLAQAIIHKPKLILLDEPTAGLDPKQITQFRAIITELKKEACIIFSSHIMQEVAQICDQAIVINQGRTIGEIDISSQKQLTAFKLSPHDLQPDFSATPHWVSQEKNIHYFNFSTPEEKQSVIALCLENQFQIESITTGQDILEDKFISILNNYEKHYL